MEKALKMGKASAIGSFQLFVGKITSTAIMAVGTLILARLMNPDEYGLYSIALTPPLMISLFRDWGVNSAITKYIVQYKTKDKDKARAIAVSGLTFEVVIGLALTLLSLVLANYIATTIFHKSETAHLISIASVTIFSGSLLVAAQSSFYGFERMELDSLTMVCQAIVKTVVSPILVHVGYGALGAVLGYTLSFLAAGIIGLATFYILIRRKLGTCNTQKLNIFVTLKTMLSFGIPLSISAILSGFLIQFYNFMIAIYSSIGMIGNYHIAVNFSMLLTFFTFPIITVLFPAFSKLDPKTEPQLLQAVFTSAVKYTTLLLVPATLAIMVLSEPMVSTLFGEQWSHAPFFLSLYILSNLFVMFGSITIGSLLPGLGETKMLMKLSLLTLSISIPLAFLLIPLFDITGAILGMIIAGVPSLIWGVYWTWKHYQAKPDFRASTKILAASITAAAITFLSLNLFSAVDWIELAIGLSIFLIVYLSTVPIIGAITITDINGLRAMLSNLGIIFTIINIPLTITEKIAIWAPKLKAKIDSLLELLYRTRKTILLLLIVSVATIAISATISIWLGRNDKFYLPNIGTLRTVGVKAYSDQNLTNITTEIQWGTIYPGTQKNVTLYLRSTSNVNTILQRKEANWTFSNATHVVSGPSNTTPYMSLTWDYDNATISPSEIVEVSLTLKVENSPDFIQFIIDNEIEQFGFDITIDAIEQTP